MAKMQKNTDGSTTYYPQPGEKRTGISYNKGKTYSSVGKPTASLFAQGGVASTIQRRKNNPEGFLSSLQTKRGK